MTNHQDDVDRQLAILRDILLHGDREKIQKLQEIIDSKDELEKRIQPILDDRIESIKDNFPTVFGDEVNREVEKKLLLSNDLILTAISPLMGKMIRKYIGQQIGELKDKIDRQVKHTFSFKRYYHLIRARIFGIQDSEWFLSQLDDFQMEIKDIFVIQRNSGLLLGSYSTSEMGDSGIFGGMLTAIKAFGEDVFKKSDEGRQELEMIDYNSHKIYMQSHHNYYFAAVLKGTITASEKNKLSDKLIKFAENEKRLNSMSPTSEDIEYISGKLKENFA